MAQQAQQKQGGAQSKQGNTPTPDANLALAQQDETVLMAMNIYAEARGESAAGRYGVANVVRNRVNASAFPNSFSSVIVQPYQFSWTRTSDPNYEASLNPSNQNVWAECYQIAREVISGGATNPVAGADHYHTTGVSPDWSQGKSPVARIGAHLFFDLLSDDNASAGSSTAQGQRSETDVAKTDFAAPDQYTDAPALSAVDSPGSGEVLRLGHQGPAVEYVQTLLGLDDPDGYFGVDTAKAVARFKQDHFLGQAEKVGYYTLQAMRRAIESEEDNEEGGDSPHAPTTSPRPRARPDRSQSLDTALEPVLRGEMVLGKRSAGDAVRALQSQLNTVGFETNVDGDYGNNTRNSVAMLQRKAGLKGDGAFGKDSAQALVDMLAEGSHVQVEITSVPIPTRKPKYVPPAASGEAEDESKEGSDIGAEAGDTDLQTADSSTQDTLDTNKLAVDEETPSEQWQSVIDGETALRKGMDGPVIEELQRRLTRAGFETKVDGDFGNTTETNVRSLQSATNQNPDGVVGKDTALAISKSTAWQAVVSGRFVLSKGMKGAVVGHMQMLLTRAGFGVASTEEFGEFTRTQVMAFQEANLIQQTGMMGATTAEILEDKAQGSATDGFIWPVRGGAYFTSPYGPRNITNGSRFHKGIDIQSTSRGAQIIAAAAGKVVAAQYGSNGGYGAYIDIEHEIKGRKFYTRYAHLSAINVNTGQRVTQGQHIGQEGGSGSRGANSYPVHLHFEIHEDALDNKVDPLKHLAVPGDVSISFGNARRRLGAQGNYKRDEEASIWSF